MPSLGEISTSSSGVLRVNSLTTKVNNKIPWCVVTFDIALEYQAGRTRGTVPEVRTTCQVLPMILHIDSRGLPIVEGLAKPYGYIDVHWTNSIQIPVRITLEALLFLEGQRNDDLTIQFGLELENREYMEATNNILAEERIILPFPQKLSQKDWLTLLNQMGYNEKWIIELDRPKLEGFHEVIEFLDKAKDGIFSNSSPDTIISDLRSAWDRFDPFLSKFQQSIKSKIDRGSKGENDQPSKDQRITEIAKANVAVLDDISKLKQAIDKLTQIGPHKESYVSTREDALLAYRLTVSLISYYSALLKVVSEKSNVR